MPIAPRRLASHAQSSALRLWRFARAELGVVAAIGVVAGGVAAFADIAEDMAEGEGQAFDEVVLHLLHPGADPSVAWGPAWLQTATLDITALGSLAVLVLFGLITTGFLLFQKKVYSALMLAVALGGGLLLSEVLKGVFERDRPPEIFRAVETINASFPSGHALLSTVFYLTLGVMLERAFARQRLKIYALAVAVLISLLVGLSRIYLGAHWASDVMAGWSLGAAWAMTCWLVAYAVQRWVVKKGLDDAEAGRT